MWTLRRKWSLEMDMDSVCFTGPKFKIRVVRSRLLAGTSYILCMPRNHEWTPGLPHCVLTIYATWVNQCREDSVTAMLSPMSSPALPNQKGTKCALICTYKNQSELRFENLIYTKQTGMGTVVGKFSITNGLSLVPLWVSTGGCMSAVC